MTPSGQDLRDPEAKNDRYWNLDELETVQQALHSVRHSAGLRVCPEPVADTRAAQRIGVQRLAAALRADALRLGCAGFYHDPKRLSVSKSAETAC